MIALTEEQVDELTLRHKHALILLKHLADNYECGLDRTALENTVEYYKLFPSEAPPSAVPAPSRLPDGIEEVYDLDVPGKD